MRRTKCESGPADLGNRHYPMNLLNLGGGNYWTGDRHYRVSFTLETMDIPDKNLKSLILAGDTLLLEITQVVHRMLNLYGTID